MIVVPLQSVPNQTVTIVLGGQPSQIDVYQKATGLFLDLRVSDVPIIVGTICHDRDFVVRSVYLGFIGDLMFFDTMGASDPAYDGIGSRYFLAYCTTADFA